MISQLFSIVAPVFICAGIGFGWARLGRGFDVDFVTMLITNIGAPCLVFHTLANLEVGASVFATMVAAALAVIVGCTAITAAILAATGLPSRTYMPAMVFANTGNMGLPLSFLAFGDIGLGFAIGVFTVYSMTMFTFGPALATGSTSWRRIAQVPILYAVPVALVFMLAGDPPPKWINATTELLGNITIPMMLIALGVSLARLKATSLPLSFGMAVLRLTMGFTVALAVTWAMDLEATARGVLIIQASMPSAVFNYLFAQRYGTSPEEVAGLVVISTALAFVLLPLLLWFVL